MVNNVFKVGLFLFLTTLLACGTKTKDDSSTSTQITTILIDEGSGIDDRSFNQSAWEGITAFYGDTPENPTQKNTFYKEIYASSPDGRLPNARLASDEAPDLVIATGFTFASVVKEVAAEYPNQKYLLIDDDSVDLPNVKRVIFAEHEAAYLVGVSVALKAKEDAIIDPKFAFLGGVPGPVLTRFEVGYIQGILSVLPDAKIVDYYANDWAKPELGKVQAKSWYDSGVYAVFTAAGGTGNGAIAQAKEYREMGKNIWVIGVDSDQYEDGLYGDLSQSVVFTSAIKRVDITTKDTLEQVSKGLFKGETAQYNLANGGVDFSIKNSSLTPEIAQQVNTIKEDIKSGKTKVISTYKDALAAGKVPATFNLVD